MVIMFHYGHKILYKVFLSNDSHRHIWIQTKQFCDDTSVAAMNPSHIVIKINLKNLNDVVKAVLLKKSHRWQTSTGSEMVKS